MQYCFDAQRGRMVALDGGEDVIVGEKGEIGVKEVLGEIKKLKLMDNKAYWSRVIFYFLKN